PFWNVAFPFGFGFLVTVVASTGLLGTLVWIAFFVLFFALGAKAIASNPENKSDRFMLVTTFLISLFLWVGAFIYGPSIVMLSLAFIFTGLFVGASEATGIVQAYAITSNQGRVRSFLLMLLALALFLGTVIFAFVSFEKIISAIHFQRALVYSNTEGKTLDQIESELGRAINTSPSDQYWSAVSQIELARANGALNSTEGTLEERQMAFQNALSASIGALQNAIDLNPSYHNWMALANLYASLVPEPLNVEGAYESARSTYDSAESLHPLSPEVPLLRAKLEFDNGNVEGAREFISLALSRKQDYAEAYFFLSQIEVNQNNLTEAIESAEMTAVLSPNNAGIFFQLGLLKYSDRDYSGAEEAFVRALALVSEYANAKYYLGLTLDRLGRKDEALNQFEDLRETNPDNPAVVEVLDNLRAGRNALESVSTDTDDLPISGQ
ncbi:MAG: tetratricopeptide repeat protein, partial [Minisyncoccota bacterium]